MTSIPRVWLCTRGAVLPGTGLLCSMHLPPCKYIGYSTSNGHFFPHFCPSIASAYVTTVSSQLLHHGCLRSQACRLPSVPHLTTVLGYISQVKCFNVPCYLLSWFPILGRFRAWQDPGSLDSCPFCPKGALVSISLSHFFSFSKALHALPPLEILFSYCTLHPAGSSFSC